MDYQSIRFECAENIARLTLSRPSRLNALCDNMVAELNDALDIVERGGARVLLMTGAGRGFCSGADLSFPTGSASDAGRDLGATLERNYNPFIKRLRAMKLPVVCAVNGVAAGAGVSLALAADIVIAARSSRFVLAFARIGLVPDAGATYFLPQRVGMARALGLAMLGGEVEAADAERWGMIWKCVDDNALMGEVNRLCEHLSTAPTQALVRTKEALYASVGNSLAAQLDLERDLQRELGTTTDFDEGVAAFLAKRPARFEGK